MMRWFLDLKLRNKIFISFFSLVILMVIMGVFGVVNLQKISLLDKDLYENSTKPISIISNVEVDLQTNMTLVRDIIIDNDVNQNKDRKNKMLENDKQIDKAMEEFRVTTDNQDIINEYNDLKSNIEKYKTVRDKIVELGIQNKNEEAIEILNGDGSALAESTSNSVQKIIDLKESLAKDKADNNSKTADTTIVIMIGIIIVGIIIALVFAVVISGLISKPINRVLFVIEEMSQGHLNERVNLVSNDEIGLMAKKMDSFADTLQNVVIGTMNRIAKGDVSIDIPIKDDKDEIAPALSKMVENVRRLVTDANMLSQAAIEGKFETRADATQHDGDYKKVIDGVNDTLDTVVDKVVWYEAIIDAIPFPIHVTDKDMNWTYMNK